MRITKNLVQLTGIAACCIFLFSCNKTDLPIIKPGSNEVAITDNFLFNVPVVADTVFIDTQYNLDMRLELKGYSIHSFKLILQSDSIQCDTNIISTRYFAGFFEPPKIEFLIRAVKLDDNKTVLFKSKPFVFKAIENLSARYVHPAVSEGKLALSWDEFDKDHAKKYIVERWCINSNFNLNPGTKKYYQKYEVDKAVFIDNYYVGEEAEYKITLINDEGNSEDSWYYKKTKELPLVSVTQNAGGGYLLHFSKCKYSANFGQYYLTDGYNSNPAFIHSTNQLTDTTYLIPDAKFGDEVRFWIRYLPRQLPDNYSESDWYIYAKFLYAQYGLSSFSYESIAALNNNNLVYTQNGKIFKYNVENRQISDSIVKAGVSYSNVASSPDGKYIYAINQLLYNSTFYLWPESFTQNPVSNFVYTYVFPPLSNNLRTIMTVPSNYSPSKLALYDVTSGNLIYTTNFNGSSSFPTISPNGDYCFIYDVNYLKLCSYKNNSFEVIWSETDWMKHYSFYRFNRLNNEVCYIWDSNKLFSIRKTSDFSLINSFSLPLESIADIDYFSNRIMGTVSGKIMIYDLNNGNLLREIPANLSEMFSYSNKTILLGNTIYNNHGIKYDLNQ